ncbi:TonB-dependent receptor [uncultured Chitinophaga sp.]|jgi:TonB-linked outer membrane protein, SusC/RagA family|uniref:SusC/RagA family TonB-linked outer membrane protein n=1 Tax=uncultured Chitinophaga sp. TaxID=339340 RepID=UPI002627C47F|nr:TonB-dependent receptor [uncultured Chitinophaga sp.]
MFTSTNRIGIRFPFAAVFLFLLWFPLRLSASGADPSAVTVTGKVTAAETNSPLPGVSVALKGTSTGTVTDSDGNYKLMVPNGEGTLVFSFVGYTRREEPINNRSSINVALSQDLAAIEEVVVVGYGTRKKSDVTGSLSSVSAQQLKQVPTQSISQALQGRAAGVDVAASSFRPGDNPQIRIRGNRSLKATNYPLVVLDGIPLPDSSSINDFNPSDIASIEILKDASATAIYGSRGANGVILVTLKKGKAGVASVSYDGYVGFSKPLTTMDMMNGGEYAELRREAYRNNSRVDDYTTPFPNPVQDFDLFKSDLNMWESVAQGYEWVNQAALIPRYRAATAEEKQRFAAYGMGSFDSLPVYDPNKVRTTDWADLALRTGLKQDHQVSVSGGSEKVRVIASLGYYNESGIQKTQSFERYNIRLGIDYNISRMLRVGGSTMANTSNQQYGSPLYFNAIGQLPIAVPYDSTGARIYQPGGDPLIFNPLFNIENVTDERRVTHVMGSYYAELQLMEGLRFRVNFGPDFRHYRRGQFYGSLSTNRNRGTSQAIYEQNQRFSYVLENLLYYDKTINRSHSIGLTLLQSLQNERYEFSGLTVSNLPYDKQLFYNLGSTNNSGPDAFSSDYSRRRLMSYMGRVNYTLMNRYLLTVSGRFDGSSVLAPGKKWEFFPSFALAWKMQEEPFLKGLAGLDELKLRIGYGKTGNSAINPYTVQGRLAKTRYVWGDNPAWGYLPSLIPNPNLKWEATHQLNAGIDFSLIKGRISGTVDVYQANTRDLIMDRQVPTASGFGFIQENIGSTRNKGVEISLSTVNLETTGGFRWNTDLVFARNKEEITELYGAKNDDIANRWFIGQPVTVFYDWKPIGVWQTNEADAAAVYNRIPGQGKILDINNDKVIDARDRVVIGNNVPDWSGSIVNTFAYKGVELSCFFYARIGQMVASSYYRPSLAGRYTERKLDYWTPSNPSNEYPRPRQDQERIDYPESYLYQKASFVKLRNVSLSYQLPKQFTSKLHIQKLRVYFTAYNPWLITDFKGLDPEFTANYQTNINDQLIENNLSDKSFVFGINVGF